MTRRVLSVGCEKVVLFPEGNRMKRRFRNLIGPQVRALRWKRGLTQEALAARLQMAGAVGLDRVKLAKIESQIRSVFDYELLVIAHVLKVSPGLLSPPDGILFAHLPKLSAWDEQGRDKAPVARRGRAGSGKK